MLVLVALLVNQAVTHAQERAPATPVGSDQPDETIWFVIAPEGKANGDYFDVTIEAGESVTVQGEFGNGSEIPVEAILYAADVVSPLNGGFSMNDSSLPVTSPTTWLSFPFETINFEPMTSVTRSLTISVPADTAPGQYITGVAIETAEAAPPPGDLPMLVKYRLMAAVLITVPGPVAAEFDIERIRVTTDERSTTISGTIQNTGNVRVRPTGKIQLINEAGAVVTDGRLTMQSVYAGHAVGFEISIPAPIPAGTYQVVTTLNDPDTGATADYADPRINVVASGAGSPVNVSEVMITPMPSAENVVFAQVAVTLVNASQPASGIRVTLIVFRDGVEIDSTEVASSVTIQTGETVIDQPYIPASGTWESGSYSFEIIVSTVDPQSGTETVLAVADPDGTIDIP
jgi:hypothetical protein